tara:strand:- start:3363 stop:3548 length:186 start_codon:yes stop_codon:yes gene_type:complete
MSQTDQILQALKNGDRVTSLGALERFGCFRLAARIGELRQKGHPIKMRMVGDKKKYAEYSL